MGKWQYINNQNDIEEFIKVTMGMHDSYMVGLDYMAGTWGIIRQLFLPALIVKI